MTQQEAVKKLKENTQQAKQFNEIATYVNEAIRQEMPTFAKLIQFDVMQKVQEKCAADGIFDKNSAVGDFMKVINDVIGQINTDLEKEIMKEFEALKEKTGS